MKKSDLDLAIETLRDLKKISDRLDYNTSTAINVRVMTILPILEKEFNRLDTDKIDITNSPRVMIIDDENKPEEITFEDFVNTNLTNLVELGNKIIDYVPLIKSDGKIIIVVKYTN